LKTKTYYTNLPDNKSRLFGGAYGIHDTELLEYRDRSIKKFTSLNSAKMSVAEHIKRRFVETYPTWMFEPFDFQNTDLLTEACFTQGTTESFAQFYIRYKDKRLRIARGEYFYHQMMKGLRYEDNFAWLDDEPISKGDVVLLSLPFADTGGVFFNTTEILDQCDKLGVPVMLDLAYLNLTVGKALNYQIDFARPCIEYVVSSLSKVFPVENMRIGIRLQKVKAEDQLYVINEENYNYINLMSAYVGTAMMEKFSANWVYNKYSSKQQEMCQQLDLYPSPCVPFGTDYHDRYSQFNRGGLSNRLCFSRIWDGRAELEGLVE